MGHRYRWYGIRTIGTDSIASTFSVAIAFAFAFAVALSAAVVVALRDPLLRFGPSR